METICAHVSHFKNPLAQAPMDKSTSSPPSPPPFFPLSQPFQPCSDGKGANTAGERCHWQPQFQSCMQAVQDIGRLIVDLKMTTSLGSTLNDQAALFRDSTACSTRRRARKGGLNKAHLLTTQLAGRGQRASYHAVKQLQKRKGPHPPVRVS